MSAPFLIRHADGREYQLSDADYFVTEYKPQGFKIVKPQPLGYAVPKLKSVDEIADEHEAELQKKSRSELNELASSLNIDRPEALPNKDALVAAIEAAQAPKDDDAT